MNEQTGSSRAARLQRETEETFRSAGWRIIPQPKGTDANLLVRKRGVAYVVEIKTASEGRADRLIPLMAQAILVARSFTDSFPARTHPLAVVAAPRISPVVAEQVLEFARVHSGDVAIGIVDLEGYREFVGHGLDVLSKRAASQPSHAPDNERVDLFSDLNQWLLKVLLARALNHVELLNSPDREYRNATELASSAGVSVMTSYRFLRQLSVEGFRDESSARIRLVRVEELLHRWQAAGLRPVAEVGAQWILANQSDQLGRATNEDGSPACVALFAAARVLGFGFVRGGPTHLYVADVQPRTLSRIGLVRNEPGHIPDVLLRVPNARHSVFRGAVTIAGVRASDVLQVWLDTANHPSRGEEQARVIFDRVIKQMMRRL